MKPKDIYNVEQKYETVKKSLEKANISQHNKELIVEFEKACVLEGLGKWRRIRIMSNLLIFARDHLKKDFDKATKEELRDVVWKLESREDLGVWTKHTYKTVLKKFYKWLVFGNEYVSRVECPEIISWLRATVSNKDKPRVKASQILTEKEAEDLVKVAEHPRDKAFICMLYELGSRIGEIGSLHIKDISRDDYSFIIDLSGKTGHRTPRIVISDSYLTAWLNLHPLKDNPNAPLWVMLGDRNKSEMMNYGAFRALVLRLAEKAKIKKRIYHHLFRHSRVTHLLTNKQINESQAKIYFGWVPNSNMLAEYSHLVAQDVNEVMLEIHGIKTSEAKQEPKVKQCHRCKDINPTDHLFCKKCGGVLEVKTAIALDEKRGGFDNILTSLMDEETVQEALVKAAMKKGLGKKLMDLYNK